ncbi:hypothetical protein BJ875DRAFT_172402 [Amylocarpus encephaloides]|uniref:Glycoside hydrolase subgroup catalytic core protein n=1 Tax=Amylocarpus encephaloides TaxID=45428 RepID=A0A9P7YPC3_9HELO|nr:hypothetical protein BJ875DRAFT_172402 [Amylocarpus encephaloides]
MRSLAIWSLHLVLFLFTNIVIGQIGFNSPPDVQTWCGKPYMSTNQSLNPGGQFQFPAAQKDPLLHVTIQPRYTIYVDGDAEAEFIVGGAISHTLGGPYINTTSDKNGTITPFDTLKFTVVNEEDGEIPVIDSISVNTTGKLFKFPLSSWTPRPAPYPIKLYGSSPDGKQTYTISTSIYFLPHRTKGSAVKIDNLHGGLYVQNKFNSHSGWYALFPVGYYADGNHVTPTVFNTTNIDIYSSQGFNTISIVPDGGSPDQSYPIDSLSKYWDHVDILNLFNIYQLRFAFQNTTRLATQVALWKDRETLLSWYTADEPDGWSYPLNSTSLAYATLRELDPYHPVSLVLNCQNYHYTSYASGADIVMQDAYPVGINATYSIPFSTPCNTTYGDCGCDNCIGSLSDVSTRLEVLHHYQAYLPPSSPGVGNKPTWSVLQAFGEQSYWPRLPTSEEVVNMMMLSINHGAKGLSYWLYPSTVETNVQTGALGRVLSSEPALGFLLGTEPVRGLSVEGVMLDVSAWVLGEKVLVGVVNGVYVDVRAPAKISMPEGVSVSGVDQVLCGDEGWNIEDGKLVKSGFKGLEVSLLVLQRNTP